MNYINEIITGNSLEILKTIPDNTVDVSLFSPPYNIKHLIRYDKKHNKYYHQKIYKDYKDDVNDYFNLLDTTIKETLRITKHNVFLNIQFLLGNKLDIVDLLYKHQKNIKDIIIWAKDNAQPAINKTQLSSQFEFIFVFSSEENCKSKPFNYAFFNNRKKGNINPNVIKGRNSSVEGNKSMNFAVFPEYLVEWILKRFTKEKDLVLDPYFGSGTTGVVAKKMNRNYLGIEMDESYVKYAKDRIDKTLVYKKWW